MSVAVGGHTHPLGAEGNYSLYGTSNQSSDLGEYDMADDIIYNAFVQALFCVVYTTIFVLGLAGNALVVFVVARNRAMHTVTNVFIGNLALSDVLLCALCVPFTPLYTFLGSWVFGGALCRAVVLAQGTSVYTSTLTLTSIAVDRFFVIVHPFRPRMRLSTCVLSLAGIWLFSVAATLPYGLYTVLRAEPDSSSGSGSVFGSGNGSASASVIGSGNGSASVSVIGSGIGSASVIGSGNGSTSGSASGPSYYYCEESWPSERARLAYGAVTAAAQFALPFGVSAFCYVRVSLRLRRRARHKPGCRSARRDDADRERKRRTNRMLVAMVAIFGLSWMPLTLLNLANDVFTSFGTWRYFNLCFFAVHALAMSSTCYNPFLYAWMNDNFRKEFRRVLPCFRPEGSGAGDRAALAPRPSCAPTGKTQDTTLPATDSVQQQQQKQHSDGAANAKDGAIPAVSGESATYSAHTSEVRLQIQHTEQTGQDDDHLLDASI